MTHEDVSEALAAAALREADSLGVKVVLVRGSDLPEAVGAALSPVMLVDPDGRCAVGPDMQVDCAAPGEAMLAAGADQAYRGILESDAGEAARGVATATFGLLSAAAGTALDFTVGFAWNSGVKFGTGVNRLVESDGMDSGPLLEGSTGILTLAVGAKVEGLAKLGSGPAGQATGGAARSVAGRVGSSFGPNTVGAAQRVLGRVVQSGGRTVSRSTAGALNRATGSSLTPREWGRALEALKRDLGLPNNHHGRITEYGHYPNAGAVELEYRYDDLHRLVYAHGEAKARPHTLDTFTSTFTYSDIHNMLTNVQEHRVLHGGGPGELPPHTNHDLAYQYAGAGPHQATRIGDTSLVYDANGNTVAECRDPADPTCTERPSHLRRYVWTEENRLDAVVDGGGKNVTKFFYDADGQRIAKLGRGGESITIGQFWSLKGRRAATKHVFAGTTRLASKLLPPPGWDDVPASEPVTVVTADLDNGCQPSSYQPQKCQALPGGEPVLNDYYANAKVRPGTYYYHPDHLGSTSWVTDQNARPHEHVEYFPYGAVWRDPRSDLGASPARGQRFLFTGKELDEETGLYYFGARYYDPVRVRWLSTDPIAQRRTYAPSPWNLSLFSYAAWSPQRLVDPNGEDPVESRIPEKPISVDDLERSGLLDEVSVEYLSQHGLLREAVARYGGHLNGLQSCEQDLLDVERAFYFGVMPILIGSAASTLVVPTAGPQNGVAPSSSEGAAAAAGGLNLAAHEAAGGHLLARHVGKTGAELAARLAAQPGIPAASTFASLAEAEAGVSAVLGARAGQLSSWVSAGAQGRLVLEAPFAGGQVLLRGASTPVAGTGVRLVLEGRGGEAWRIVTGFPIL